jgi:hypothetical protein
MIETYDLGQLILSAKNEFNRKKHTGDITASSPAVTHTLVLSLRQNFTLKIVH